MKNRITLKKRSDPRKFAIPCTVKGIEFPHALCDTGASVSILPRVMADNLGLKVEPSKESFNFVDCSQRSSGAIVRDLEVQIGNALVPVDFYILDINLNWTSSLLLRRAFLSTVGATSSRRIDDPGLIAACHCGAEYETKYYASIENHTATSIHSAKQKSIDIHKEESIDSSQAIWRMTTTIPPWWYTPRIPTRDTLHTEENATSIDKNIPTSIDTHHHQTNRKRASTDIAYYPSINTGVDRAREGDYSIGSWADDHYHESYAVETAVHEPEVDEPHEGPTEAASIDTSTSSPIDTGRISEQKEFEGVLNGYGKVDRLPITSTLAEKV
ncbi:hypothetical protein F2Q70_00003023 [Brassica cretica]|uniref:Uncharacterized protein n=1 Tax=Brassica cretica TaxID=69181 RepID=A0A8S9IM62_BRACR|nr:hypothetical protein F2Q70_00003023 [Brassica cretica]